MLSYCNSATPQEDTSAQAQQGFLQQDSNPSTDEVQLAAKGEKPSESQIQQVAATGFSGSSTSLPHLDRIQQSFAVDLSSVQAYIGGEAAGACQQMGAAAYASGDRIAFKEQPSLELAAHEAAHVVQQASGKVQLAGGVGQVGDKYENHADAVAAKVGAGESAAPLLADFTGPKTDRHSEILSQRQPPANQDSTESHQSQTTVDRLNEARRLLDLGFLNAREGKIKEALKFFEASLQLAPNESITWYNRGVAFIR
jgi:tetratricopeptide (TPR) repeat protein